MSYLPNYRVICSPTHSLPPPHHHHSPTPRWKRVAGVSCISNTRADPQVEHAGTARDTGGHGHRGVVPYAYLWVAVAMMVEVVVVVVVIVEVMVVVVVMVEVMLVMAVVSGQRRVENQFNQELAGVLSAFVQIKINIVQASHRMHCRGSRESRF